MHGTRPPAIWLKYDNIVGSPDSLDKLDETMGVWIHMTTADTLDVVGSKPVTSNIALDNYSSGWNLVGYPSITALPLPDVLRDHGVGTDFTLVYAYHVSDTGDPWKLYDRLGSVYANDLLTLSPGWGYWIKVSVDHTWSVGY